MGVGAGAGAGAAAGDSSTGVGASRAEFVASIRSMDWVPVLIDFGLTKELPTHVRLAVARMVVSAELVDYGGLLDSHVVRAFGCVARTDPPCPPARCRTHACRLLVPENCMC